MSYLLTYEDAQEICKRYNDTNFWEYQYMIGKYKVCSFNYFICGWDDFNNPLPNKPEVNAFDMRGSTFVFNEDGTLSERFFMLPKFFNINQVESTQYGDVKDKKIDTITVKEDGSLVAFMMLPNRDIFSKTIGSFVSDQAIAALELLRFNKTGHYEWVKNILYAGYTPLFEYVSWDNRIVLRYSEAQLKFIGIRCNLTGEYYPYNENIFNVIPSPPDDISVVKNEHASLDELLEKAKTEENSEGWVVQFVDGQMIKVKTSWYFLIHCLRTQDVFREDYVIRNYLNETLDDITTQLNPEEDVDAFEFIENVCKATNKYINEIDECTRNLKEKYIKIHDSDWIKFATENHKEPYFALSKTLIEKPKEYRERKIEFILKSTSKLKRAKEIIERFKN